MLKHHSGKTGYRVSREKDIFASHQPRLLSSKVNIVNAKCKSYKLEQNVVKARVFLYFLMIF